MTMMASSYLKDDTLAKRWFWALLLLHGVVWTLGPSLFRASVTHDTLEAIAWGSQWQWGYNKHPFLSAWLSYAVTNFFHVTGWPVYLLAQVAVLTTFWATWRLALKFMSTTNAVIAAIALEGVLFYNLNTFNFTPDTLQSPLWALAILCFYHALKSQSFRAWIGVGVFIALSWVTKYQVVVLCLPMMMLVLGTREGRESFKTPGFYAALAIGCVMTAPHFYWLAQHDYVSFKYAFETPSLYTTDAIKWPHVVYPLRYMLNNLGNCALMLVLLWPCYSLRALRKDLIPRAEAPTPHGLSAGSTYSALMDAADKPRHVASGRHVESLRLDDNLTSFQWQFLILIGLGPVVITTLLCAFGGHHFPARWSTPYFFMLGILIMAVLRPVMSKARIKAFGLTMVAFIVLLAVGRFGVLAFHQHHQDRSDASLPNQSLSRALTSIWHQRYNAPLAYIGGSRYLVTALVAYSKDRPKPYLSLDKIESPWIDDKDVMKRGAIIVIDKDRHYVWDKESGDINALNKKLKNASFNAVQWQQLVIPRLDAKGEKITLLVGFLPPSLNKSLDHPKI